MSSTDDDDEEPAPDVESDAHTVPSSSEDENRPAAPPKPRAVARRTGGPRLKRPTTSNRPSTSNKRLLPSTSQSSPESVKPPRKRARQSSPARSCQSDGSNASAKLGPATPHKAALFAPEDDSDDETDTKPVIATPSRQTNAPSRLVSRSPPSDHTPPQPRPAASGANQSSAPTSRAAGTRPGPSPAKVVDHGPVRLNRIQLESLVKRQDGLHHRLPKGVDSLEDKLRTWWSVDVETVPLLSPAASVSGSQQTVYIHAPQATLSLAQRALASKAGAILRVRETEDDVNALELLLCQAGRRVNLVRTMDGELDVVFVHASCSEDDLFQLKAVRQMGIKDVTFFRFGENFATKKRDNCHPIWTIREWRTIVSVD